MIIYDIETKKAILGRNETKRPGIEYAEGWHDYAGMGIACIGVYDYERESSRVFLSDNLDEFAQLLRETNCFVGFNNNRFDNKLLMARGVPMPAGRSYDILEEIWRGAGLAPEFDYKTHSGLSLGAVVKANFNRGKTDDGALAPIYWQQGKTGRVIDYCLADVALTRLLLERIIRRGWILDPRNPGAKIPVRPPSPEVKR
jgi:DEAD/DEAH box helicase domain-containing protein